MVEGNSPGIIPDTIAADSSSGDQRLLGLQEEYKTKKAIISGETREQVKISETERLALIEIRDREIGRIDQLSANAELILKILERKNSFRYGRLLAEGAVAAGSVPTTALLRSALSSMLAHIPELSALGNEIAGFVAGAGIQGIRETFEFLRHRRTGERWLDALNMTDDKSIEASSEWTLSMSFITLSKAIRNNKIDPDHKSIIEVQENFAKIEKALRKKIRKRLIENSDERVETGDKIAEINQNIDLAARVEEEFSKVVVESVGNERGEDFYQYILNKVHKISGAELIQRLMRMGFAGGIIAAGALVYDAASHNQEAYNSVIHSHFQHEDPRQVPPDHQVVNEFAVSNDHQELIHHDGLPKEINNGVSLDSNHDGVVDTTPESVSNLHANIIDHDLANTNHDADYGKINDDLERVHHTSDVRDAAAIPVGIAGMLGAGVYGVSKLWNRFFGRKKEDEILPEPTRDVKPEEDEVELPRVEETPSVVSADTSPDVIIPPVATLASTDDVLTDAGETQLVPDETRLAEPPVLETEPVEHITLSDPVLVESAANSTEDSAIEETPIVPPGVTAQTPEDTVEAVDLGEGLTSDGSLSEITALTPTAEIEAATTTVEPSSDDATFDVDRPEATQTTENSSFGRKEIEELADSIESLTNDQPQIALEKLNEIIVDPRRVIESSDSFSALKFFDSALELNQPGTAVEIFMRSRSFIYFGELNLCEVANYYANKGDLEQAKELSAKIDQAKCPVAGVVLAIIFSQSSDQGMKDRSIDFIENNISSASFQGLGPSEYSRVSIYILNYYRSGHDSIIHKYCSFLSDLSEKFKAPGSGEPVQCLEEVVLTLSGSGFASEAVEAYFRLIDSLPEDEWWRNYYKSFNFIKKHGLPSVEDGAWKNMQDNLALENLKAVTNQVTEIENDQLTIEQMDVDHMIDPKLVPFISSFVRGGNWEYLPETEEYKSFYTAGLLRPIIGLDFKVYSAPTQELALLFQKMLNHYETSLESVTSLNPDISRASEIAESHEAILKKEKAIAERIKEIYEKSGNRTESEVAALTSQFEEILKEEKKKGEGQLKPTIPEMTGKESFVDRKVAYLAGDCDAIFIGDTHGDSDSVRAIIEQTDFIGKMARGINIKLVLWGTIAIAVVQILKILNSLWI